MTRLLVLLSFLIAAGPAPKAKDAKDAKPLKVAVAAGYFPMLWADEKGQLDGFDLEYLEELAKKLGRKVETETVPFDQIVQTVKDGKADLGMAALDLYRDTHGVAFVEYFQIPESLIAKADNPVQPAEEPDLRKVVVGSLTIAEAREFYQKQAEKKKVAKARGYEGEPALLDALERGMIDVAVVHLPSAVEKVEKSKGKLKIVAPEVMRQPVGIAVDPKQPELFKAVKAAAAALQKDGTVAKLEKANFNTVYKTAHTAVHQ